ncbi:MAG: TVP38/TMEM64 family protein [Pirellulales bacterium]
MAGFLETLPGRLSRQHERAGQNHECADYDGSHGSLRAGGVLSVGRRDATAEVGTRRVTAGFARPAKRQGFKIVLLTRLSPIFPFNLLNYAYGLTGVKFWSYVPASWIGMLPGTIMYVYFGSLARNVAAVATGREKTTIDYVFYGVGLVVTVAVVVLVTRVAGNALKSELPEAAERFSEMGVDVFLGGDPRVTSRPLPAPDHLQSMAHSGTDQNAPDPRARAAQGRHPGDREHAGPASTCSSASVSRTTASCSPASRPGVAHGSCQAVPEWPGQWGRPRFFCLPATSSLTGVAQPIQ